MVTGATSGIGKVCALKLAGFGAELFLICRDRTKGERTKAEILATTGNEKISILVGNLSSLTEVQNVSQEFLEQSKPLHLLLNNAGVFNMKRIVTVDGYEEMIAVNHLAHFYLTALLLDRIKASSPARIVNVSSGAHKMIKGMNFDDLGFEQGYSGMKVYAHSKLANMLFNHELAKRLEGSGVTANAVHPGEIATNLGAQNGAFGKLVHALMKIFLQAPEKGARTSMYACVSPELEGVTGGYFANCEKKDPKPWANDATAAQRLWEISEQLTDIGTRHA